MNQGWLYEFTQHVLVSNTVLSDITRGIIALMSVFVAATLAKMYHEHKTGNMPKQAAIGSVLTYISVGYAQIIALSTPGVNDLTVLNIMVLIAILFSALGVVQVMHVTLFRSKDNGQD